jgi:cytochrome b561
MRIIIVRLAIETCIVLLSHAATIVGVGNFLTYYLFPAHVGAVAFHYMFRGHNLLRRMNPLGKQVIGK